MKRDDGAVVYLNGTEVFRSNMPTGTIAFNTEASASIEDETFKTQTISPTLLLSGNNVIAVEIHQGYAGSSDDILDLELTGTFSAPATPPAAPSDLVATAAGTSQINLTWVDNANNETGFIVERSLDGSTGWTQVAAPGQNATGLNDTQNLNPATKYFYRVRATNAVGPSDNSNIANATTAATPPSDQTVTYISTGAAWKYLDNGSDQGTGWRASGFDDSSWKSGAAQLGYGDGDEATVVSFGPNSNAKFITTYFRKSFTVADASAVKSLALRYLRDDGAVIYLNGTEITRDNMPSGTISFATTASDRVTSDDESAFHSATIDPALLRTGTNVIAVEIHQSEADSSDISFDLELKATVGQAQPPPPGPTLLPAPFVTNNIGPVAVAGGASFDKVKFTIAGDGADIWGKSDSFRYVYQQLDGDGEIVVRVATQEKKNLLAKAGIMIRDTLAHDAKSASLFVTPAAGVRFIRRDKTGGHSTAKVDTDNFKHTAPIWLRLVRSGDTITAFRSPDGATWQFVGSDTIDMSQTSFVGMAVTSHQSGQTNTATFDNVSVVA
jgi:regulation of enolase protein 1 (concanavalin A-like superfamily)